MRSLISKLRQAGAKAEAEELRTLLYPDPKTVQLTKALTRIAKDIDRLKLRPNFRRRIGELTAPEFNLWPEKISVPDPATAKEIFLEMYNLLTAGGLGDPVLLTRVKELFISYSIRG